MRWEYKVFNYSEEAYPIGVQTDGGIRDDWENWIPYSWRYMEDRLQEFGDEGWELVSERVVDMEWAHSVPPYMKDRIDHPNDMQVVNVTWIFKRLKEK